MIIDLSFKNVILMYTKITYLVKMIIKKHKKKQYILSSIFSIYPYRANTENKEAHLAS